MFYLYVTILSIDREIEMAKNMDKKEKVENVM